MSRDLMQEQEGLLGTGTRTQAGGGRGLPSPACSMCVRPTLWGPLESRLLEVSPSAQQPSNSAVMLQGSAVDCVRPAKLRHRNPDLK